ncbi:MAG: chromosome partitioning protein ParB [Paracoccus denitrificans]|uniref:Chromosome partitioning protein ParB n=1 Tax=Paracoccus denitrificans TaxID=266 RepID=A0A533I4K0_PARDE|nr:MAG: chromosome partitioning protein ParB [Paracoccus denitrificans]
MAKAARKKPVAPMIVFSRARDIPFNRIRLSDSNVRETDVEAGLDELTHDIDRREDLVQGLNVRAILDEDGNETGEFETPAGGRRYRSIARLVEAGRCPAEGLVPCIVKKADAKTSAVDDSLAENLLRLALHPLDQFKAFKRMFDMGMSKEEIADAWRTTPRYIMQRLRLATVAPTLHDAYARNEMTLAMLEAFTVNPDHERQQQVWERISTSWQKEPWQIRNMLTETTVPAADKRARFIGVDAYDAAGGPVLRDLFSEENGGWLQDVTLLDRLVDEKLRTVADEIAGQGWKWIDAAVELPYGHTNGLRRLVGVTQELTDEERATREALRDEYDELEAQYAEADELPDEVDQRLGEIEAELEAFENRPVTFAPEDIARAGVFVSIGRDGELIVSNGYVRSEDEQPETVDGEDATEGADPSDPDAVQRAVITVGGEPVPDADEEDDDAVKPLPERLVTDLTAWRTLALRNALAKNPRVAMTALLHKLVLDTFERTATSGTSLYAAVRDDDRLWDWIDGLDDASRLALLAHCVSFGVNALYERPNPYSGNGISQHGLDRRMAEAERLAQATGLDLVEAGWRPTVENYLGRVTKTRIIEAVREGAGDRAADLIAHLKKGDMAKEAERLLADTGWLPEPLRPAIEAQAVDGATDQDEDSVALPDFLAGGHEDTAEAADDPEALVAAE